MRKASALAVMDVVLSATLRLLHPFMPHVTEELWHLLALGKDSIQFVKPPEATDLPPSAAKQRSLVRSIYDAVQSGRNLRSEAKIRFKQRRRDSFCVLMMTSRCAPSCRHWSAC